MVFATAQPASPTKCVDKIVSPRLPTTSARLRTTVPLPLNSRFIYKPTGFKLFLTSSWLTTFSHWLQFGLRPVSDFQPLMAWLKTVST